MQGNIDSGLGHGLTRGEGGCNVSVHDFVDVQGDSRLAQMWTMLHFGDYLAYYLAMAYQVDPTQVAAIEDLKARMKAKH